MVWCLLNVRMMTEEEKKLFGLCGRVSAKDGSNTPTLDLTLPVTSTQQQTPWQHPRFCRYGRDPAVASSTGSACSMPTYLSTVLVCHVLNWPEAKVIKSILN